MDHLSAPLSSNLCYFSRGCNQGQSVKQEACISLANKGINPYDTQQHNWRQRTLCTGLGITACELCSVHCTWWIIIQTISAGDYKLSNMLLECMCYILTLILLTWRIW